MILRTPSSSRPRLSRPRRLSAGVATALAALALVIAVPTAAHAESGYRVCGVYGSAQSNGEIGTGLVTKVWKDDNTNTCGYKIAWMATYFGNAWRGAPTPDNSYRMMTCEEFADRSGIAGDPCPSMAVNKIYRNYSPFDLVHPQKTGWVEFYAN